MTPTAATNGNQPIALLRNQASMTAHFTKDLEGLPRLCRRGHQDDEKPRDNRTSELALDACREYAQEQEIAVTEALNGSQLTGILYLLPAGRLPHLITHRTIS